jgi:hypothetical protein
MIAVVVGLGPAPLAGHVEARFTARILRTPPTAMWRPAFGAINRAATLKQWGGSDGRQA